MKLPIYLDYSATTPVDSRVAARMIPYLTQYFGNPASRSHAYGSTAEKAVEEARAQVAALINADSDELLYELGLRNGDVPLTLNGLPLDDYQDAFAAYLDLYVSNGETEYTLETCARFQPNAEPTMNFCGGSRTIRSSRPL